jgi:hypothetical protein
MKIKCFLFQIILFFSSQLFSQDYEPIIKDGSFWDIKTEYFSGTKEFKRIQVDGEIEINNKIYTKLKQATIQVSDNSSQPQFKIDIDNFYEIDYVYLREDVNQKKLYIFDNNQNKEFVLCDFNLKIGDEIDNYYGHQSEDSNVTIIDISLDENNKKVFQTNQGVSYTEGIGKSDNNLTSYINTVDGFTETVFCNGNAENQNDCATVLNTNNYDLSSINTYPNPVKNILTIQNTENITIKIYSIKGSLLKTKSSSTNLKIDISAFSNGIYLLEVSNSTSKERRKLIKI